MKKMAYGLVGAALALASSSFAAGKTIMNDGFEAAKTLAGNEWSGNWSISASTWGNPGNYAWSDGSKGVISKDTGHVIQSGDQFALTFDLKDMDGKDSASPLVVTLFYKNGVDDVVLGTASYADVDYTEKVWTAGVTLSKLAATAESVGKTLLVSFGYTYSGPQSRLGVDNVKLTVVIP